MIGPEDSARKFFALASLASGQCYKEIETIFLILIGILTGFCSLGIFYLLNMYSFRDYAAANGIVILYDEPTLAITTGSGIAIMSIGNALLNTICTLLFLAILLILIEYTISFCRVAYLYDNESWDLVNIPKHLVKQLQEHTGPSMQTLMAREVNAECLRVAVFAVKHPEKGYTDKSVPDINKKDPADTQK